MLCKKKTWLCLFVSLSLCLLLSLSAGFVFCCFCCTSNVDLRETSASVECVYMQDDISLYLSDSLCMFLFFLIVQSFVVA